MARKQKTRYAKLSAIVAVLSQCICDRTFNNRRKLRGDVLKLLKTVYKMKPEDLAEFEDFTLGDIIAAYEEVALPFNPKMTGQISQEKYDELHDEREKVYYAKLQEMSDKGFPKKRTNVLPAAR
jgi:hypothetical protein